MIWMKRKRIRTLKYIIQNYQSHIVPYCQIPTVPHSQITPISVTLFPFPLFLPSVRCFFTSCGLSGLVLWFSCSWKSSTAFFSSSVSSSFSVDDELGRGEAEKWWAWWLLRTNGLNSTKVAFELPKMNLGSWRIQIWQMESSQTGFVFSLSLCLRLWVICLVLPSWCMR